MGMRGHPGLCPLTTAEVQRLGEGRVVVRDGVLGEALARAAADAVRRLDASGELTPAGIGRGGALHRDVRGDRTAWLDRTDEAPLGSLFLWFDLLRGELNRAAWLDLARFEVQVACYPGDGRGYARHRDAFAGSDARIVTALVYLNPDWEPSHGGVLRAWEPEGPVDVAPRLDRLVLFRSELVEHEVRPVHAPRAALTAWYRRPEAVPLLADPGGRPVKT